MPYLPKTPHVGLSIDIPATDQTIENIRTVAFNDANRRGCKITTSRKHTSLVVTVTHYTPETDQGFIDRTRPRTVSGKLRLDMRNVLQIAGKTLTATDPRPPTDRKTPFRTLIASAARSEQMTVETRTYNDKTVIRRMDITDPPVTGYTPHSTETERDLTTLHAYMPWPNDPDHDRKVELLDRLAEMLTDTDSNVTCRMEEVPSDKYKNLGNRAVSNSHSIGLDCHHCKVTWNGCAAECCCPKCGAPKNYYLDGNGECLCEVCKNKT